MPWQIMVVIGYLVFASMVHVGYVGKRLLITPGGAALTVFINAALIFLLIAGV